MLEWLSLGAGEQRRYALTSMNLIEQIEGHEFLYLTEIGELDVNVLRLVIDEAKADSETRDIVVGETVISGARPIVSDSSCHRYEIIFGSYVAYSVRNESYTVGDEAEQFTGRLYRKYSQSRFLEFVRTASIASDDYPGPLIHHGIICEDHVVDVASVDEPEVRMLGRA
jgi:hypothetical protein